MTGRRSVAAFVVIGLAVAIGLAVFVSPEASSKPDGLNKVAIDQGFDQHETAHRSADLPTAGYAVRGVDSERWSTGLAGLIGVAVTFALGTGLVLLARRSGRRPGGALAGDATGPTAAG